jgi:hypothetical protein
VADKEIGQTSSDVTRTLPTKPSPEAEGNAGGSLIAVEKITRCGCGSVVAAVWLRQCGCGTHWAARPSRPEPAHIHTIHKAATTRLDEFVGPKDRAVPLNGVHYTA